MAISRTHKRTANHIGFFNNFIAASLLMFGLVMAFNMFSDALQDALDPRSVR